MRFLGTTARRVVYAILLTALIPLLCALLISRAIIARVSATAFQPEFGAQLDRALGVYADLARTIKQGMRFEAQAIAASAGLDRGAMAETEGELDAKLDRAFAAHPSLAQLSVETCDGRRLAKRERPIDLATERTLTVRRAIGSVDTEGGIECSADRPSEPRVLVATFSTPRARLDELEAAQAFAQAYHQIEQVHREEYLDQTYGNAFAALLLVTLVLGVTAGVLVARPVTRRIAALSAATRPVAEGDLSVRVAIEGRDEVAELGRAFNRMLEELDHSRARVEFLKRMAEWQQVARRLAHEIKNPLTPILLAVEECHRRYRGHDAEYLRIVETTHEIVAEEVGTLRRLVSEFSSFARLPRAELAPADLGVFLREQRARFGAGEQVEGNACEDSDPSLFGSIDLTFEIPDEPMPAALDLEMLHRVLINAVRNAAQAIRDGRLLGGARGQVRIAVRLTALRYLIFIDDDGPGIPAEVEQAIFDPYVTTKRDGTGLGLSIVKKIIVDHGGTIDTGPSPLGGARFRIAIPRADTAEARAAMEHGEGEAAPASATGRG
jgi:two-component system, NtrC family, nitrogen regulation sensor histidine kinase NtrY